MNHTKEPWALVGKDSAHIWDVDFRMIADVVGERCFEENRANARRIVACVNACAGMPISDVEKLSAMGNGVMQLVVLADDYRTKCANLEQFLADDIKDALTDLLNYIDNAGWTRSQQAEHDDCARMIEKLDKLCAPT